MLLSIFGKGQEKEETPKGREKGGEAKEKEREGKVKEGRGGKAEA